MQLRASLVALYTKFVLRFPKHAVGAAVLRTLYLRVLLQGYTGRGKKFPP